MRIACYQFNPNVGDVDGNISSIMSAMQAAKSSGAQIFLLPELAVTGYAMQDLILRPSFQSVVHEYINHFLSIQDLIIVAPLPFQEGGILFNSILIIKDGQIIDRYDKFSLPNYGVFDENRYFAKGTKLPTSLIFNHQNGEKIKYSFLICEDIWQNTVHRNKVLQENDLVLVTNASPFATDKHHTRISLIAELAKQYNTAIIYINQNGAEDGLIFDGASFAVNSDGIVAYQAPSFEYSLDILSINKEDSSTTISSDILCQYPEKLEAIYKALVLGLADYYKKNNFKKIVLGLSGGIDSALTLMIAVDAVGADNVKSFMLYSKYNSKESLQTAKILSKNLNVDHQEIDIMPTFKTMLESIGVGNDLSMQNLQARIRGVMLMFYANEYSGIVVNTSNKSEIALGYGTLYGDMAGGYAVLKDVYKTTVYELVKFRDPNGLIVPEHIITRPPSAELKENQQDDDTLPPYDKLDQILELLVEKQLAVENIIAQGFDEDMVHYVAKTLFANEYKRCQLAVGTKISDMAFNIDWRYPITKKVDLIS